MAELDRRAFDEVMEYFDPDIREIAGAARALIFDVLPATVEVVWPRQRTIGYGTGPKKMSEHFCAIAPYKRHVILVFNYGSELPDPQQLLEGSGKLFRHVRLESVDDVQRPAVRELLELAITHRVPPPIR